MNYKATDIITNVTTDYDGFNKLLGNRDVKEDRVNSIIDSINKVGYQPVAILINEKFEVIDGQGRLEACKRLNLPIYFTIKKGIGISECIAMNIKMKNWDIYDYIHSYAAQGNENYIKLLEYEKKSDDISVLEVGMCLSDAWSRNVDRPLREGKFKIIETQENIACLNFICGILKTLKNIKGGSSLYIPVLVGLYKFNLIDDDRMTDAINTHFQTMGSAYNADDALTELQNVYNYHKRHNEYFRDKYLQSMEGRGARYRVD